MNPLWLLLIVPVVFTAGYMTCALMVAAKRDDDD